MEVVIQQELSEKKNERLPYLICPGSIQSLHIDDKDGNQVFRIVAYQKQANDVIKAFRKKNITAKIFNYDKK